MRVILVYRVVCMHYRRICLICYLLRHEEGWELALGMYDIWFPFYEFVYDRLDNRHLKPRLRINLSGTYWRRIYHISNYICVVISRECKYLYLMSSFLKFIWQIYNRCHNSIYNRFIPVRSNKYLHDLSSPSISGGFHSVHHHLHLILISTTFWLLLCHTLINFRCNKSKYYINCIYGHPINVSTVPP